MYYSDEEQEYDYSDSDDSNEIESDSFDDFENIYLLYKDIKDRYSYIEYTLINLTDLIYNHKKYDYNVITNNKKYNKIIQYYHNEIYVTHELINKYTYISLDTYKNFFYTYHKNINL